MSSSTSYYYSSTTTTTTATRHAGVSDDDYPYAIKFNRQYNTVATTNPPPYEQDHKHWVPPERKKNHRRRQQLTNNDISRLNILLAILVAALPWAPYLYIKTHHRRTIKSTAFFLDSRETSIANLEQTKQTIDHLVHGKLATIRAETNELFARARNHGRRIDSTNEHYLKAEAIEEQLIKRMDRLQTFIQDTSKQFVKDTYGYGPYRVEIRLATGEERLVIELFSHNEMPHSIEAFLGMVGGVHGENNNELLSFVHEGDVLKSINLSAAMMPDSPAATTSTTTTTAPPLAFAEYSEHRPHLQYTVGFKNHGPEFYINLADNTAKHTEDHDPCFGIVVEGHDVLDKLVKLQIDHHSRRRPESGGSAAFVKNKRGGKVLGIKSMRLLEREKPKRVIPRY